MHFKEAPTSVFTSIYQELLVEKRRKTIHNTCIFASRKKKVTNLSSHEKLIAHSEIPPIYLGFRCGMIF